ncbi:MAG: GNAT family N-acetyltransferase [Lachnospiraceae bacterium]|nr:GNAT family N-acetyltransferase [Lachnospiraceae bacterium]
MDYEYKEATEELLEKIWEKNIEDNKGDERWLRWREEYLTYNLSGKAKTFLILFHGEPIGEGTLLFSEECSAVGGRKMLADGRKTANVNALRIEKAHEGKGHISALVRMMERFAMEQGCKKLTIGVEAKESRNLSIYLHWGYNEFVHSCTEDNTLVLYYAKQIDRENVL